MSGKLDEARGAGPVIVGDVGDAALILAGERDRVGRAKEGQHHAIRDDPALLRKDGQAALIALGGQPNSRLKAWVKALSSL